MGLKDIAKYPLILPPKHLSTHRVVESVLTEHGLEHDVKLEVGGYDVIKKYVGLGTGNFDRDEPLPEPLTGCIRYKWADTFPNARTALC